MLGVLLPTSTFSFIAPCSPGIPAICRNDIFGASHLTALVTRQRHASGVVVACAEDWCLNRRNLLYAFVMAPVLFPKYASAASELEGGKTEEAAEGIRKMASKLPGLGPPDVIYPDVMEGWHPVLV